MFVSHASMRCIHSIIPKGLCQLMGVACNKTRNRSNNYNRMLCFLHKKFSHDY